MKRTIWIAILLLCFGFAAGANAVTYTLLPLVSIASNVGYTTSGSQSGVPATSFDGWGITKDRDVSCCYDFNRQQPPTMVPGNGQSIFNTGPLSLSVFSTTIPAHLRPICGYPGSHLNYSTLWVHPKGADSITWSPAVSDWGMGLEFQ